jgi:ABC-type multidrug transport system fused ATPase/permease subunit
VILVLLFAFARVMPLVSSLEQSLQQLLNMLPDLVAVLALETRLGTRDAWRARQRGQFLRRRRAARRGVVSVRGTAEPALRSVSLTIPVGQTTAIVGPSGSGKSTLADLLLVCSRRRMARCWSTTRR